MKIVNNKHYIKILFHFSKKKSMDMQSWLSFNTVITLSKIKKKINMYKFKGRSIFTAINWISIANIKYYYTRTF